jgi:hypothetical protein
MILSILKIGAAIVTVLVGAVSVFNPTGVRDFTGLDVAGNPRGITEVRSILGAFFIGLGAAPLIWRAQSESMYLMLGFTYLVVGGVRTVSMFIDGSVVLGVILVWPAATP